MSPGAIIRRMFGPYERQISEAYRRMFIDLDRFTALIQAWRPAPQRILEVGCGEGAMTERLSRAYPEAEIVAIDITPRLGRLYRGSSARVRFIECTVQEIAAAQPGAFDLVLLSDVLHHVPIPQRQGLLDAVRQTLAANGGFIFKDWERTTSLIHWACYASDRWLTGDKVSYMTRPEMLERLHQVFAESAIIAEKRCAPHVNNLAFLVQARL